MSDEYDRGFTDGYREALRNVTDMIKETLMAEKTNQQPDLETLERIYQGGVVRAIEEAHEKHGPLTPNHPRAMCILVEEVGEAMAEILELTRAHAVPFDRPRQRTRAIIELEQVAAMAMLIMANLEEDEEIGYTGNYNERREELR